MGPLLCTKCSSGNRLDCSTWSIRSILGGRCVLSRMDPTAASLDNRQAISRCEGWDHCLNSTELVRTTGRLNVAAISVAQSVPSRPSIEKCMAVGLGSRWDVCSSVKI